MNELHVSSNPSIAIVGAGPRGTSILERLGANLPLADSPDLRLDVHIIDDAPSGAGRIWRTDQPRDLCMNTLAHAVTLFTEPGASIEGPVREGPTLYEWAVLVRERAVSARDGLAADYAEELEAMRPESHPSRAFYGEYLAWCFERALASLPDRVRVTRHHAQAVGIERVAGCERLALHDGSVVVADAVVLATGWLQSAESQAERKLALQIASADAAARHTWVRPASPIEQDLSAIEAGQPVIMRGLGMSFFDTLALLTLGRGGHFEDDNSAAGGLRYVASGAEPVVYATSRRGVPFRSKSLYGGLPPKPEQRFLRAVDWTNEPRPINFDHRMWPRVVGDAFLDHALTLARLRPEAVTAPGNLEATISRVISEIEADFEALHAHTGSARGALVATITRVESAVAAHIPDLTNRFDLAGEVDPARGQFVSPAAFDAWVAARVATDLREAEQGLDSAVKAGLWSISAARGFASRVGTLGGFDAESRASGFRLLFDIGGMAGSGPPAFRNRQLLALSAAGLVRFVGPNAEVSATDTGFTAVSPGVDGSRVEADALVDAWMHFHSLDATADPLASTLLRTGRARPFCIASRAASGAVPGAVSGAVSGAVTTGSVSTGGFDIDPATGLLVGADGTLDTAVHVAGIPADQTLHDTVISPMPGTDPPMLRETDRVARSAIRIALASHPSPILPLAAQREGAFHA